MSDRIATNRHGSAVFTQPSDTEILMVRQFDAPAALVFTAWTTPEYVQQWWGYETSEWLVCEIDLRVGGQWRWVVRERDMEVGFHGEYREIDAPQRLVYTEVYEGAPAGPDDFDFGTPDTSLNIVTLDEVDGVTTMSILMQVASKEVRDGMVESGMEDGTQVSFDRMETLVARLAR